MNEYQENSDFITLHNKNMNIWTSNPKGSPEKQVTHMMEQKHPASAFSQLQWMLHYQMVN